jgi:cystathionine beta-lyase/cystathionine gamma-synthase
MASGIAAVHLVLLSLCKQGDHVLFFAEMYQPTRYIVRRLLARYGVRSTMLSIEDTEGIVNLMAATPTRLVVFETPSNPLLKIADLEAICVSARKHGALTVLDNTFAGFHNHGQFDVDVFVHSLTKYAAGHGDVMGGAVIASPALIDSMRADFVVMGATLDPHAAFLIQRGLKTYSLRYERQCENAMRVAAFLAGRKEARAVHYPGLESHPRIALARKQMHDFGTIVTFELAGDRDAARRFSEALKLFAISASLGSTESLVQPGELMRPRDLTEEERTWAGVSDSTIRLSIGIEDAQDLLGDLDQALNAVNVSV